MRYQYILVDERFDHLEMLDALTTNGKDGWHVVGVLPGDAPGTNLGARIIMERATD